MESFFGVPTTWLAAGALALLALAFGLLGWRARRWPIFARLGVRQLGRRPAQTALIVLGLTLSTTLVAASLATGDSIAQSLRAAAVGELGPLDEIVTYATPEPSPAAQGGGPLGGAFFPRTVADRVESAVRADPALAERVVAVAPAIWLSCSLLDLTTHQTAGALVRAPAVERAAAFGELVDGDGRALRLADLRPGEVYLNDAGGRGLAARIGDELSCAVGGVPQRWRVAAISAQRGLGSGLIAGVFLPLEHLQAGLGERGTGGVADGVNQVWLANRGDPVASAAASQAVVERLRPLLVEAGALDDLRRLLGRADLQAGLAARRPALPERTQSQLAQALVLLARGAPPAELEPALRGRELGTVLLAAARDAPDRELAPALETALRRALAFQVVPIKREALETADRAGNLITTSFLLFALLSIASSLLLIFLIFSLLAASRRSEMGVARALGTERGHLVATFTFEGTAYALLAAALGLPLGLAISRLMTFVLVRAVENGTAGFTGTAERVAETLTWRVAPASLVLALALGLLLTVGTVAWSAWQVARVTIVTAIRDLPEPPPPATTRRSIGWWPLLLALALGGLSLGLLLRQALPVGLGVSGLLLVLGRFWPRPRLGATLAGGGLALYWALPFDAGARLGLPRLSGGIELFALGALGLVAGAAWTLTANADLLERAIARGLGLLRRPAPALRLAAAHALRRPFQTGLTTTMFALVILMLTVMQVITVSARHLFADPFVVYGGWDVQAQTEARPPPDPDAVVADLAARDELQPLIAAAGVRATTLAGVLQPSAPSPRWGGYQVASVDEGFAAGNEIPLQARAPGYPSDRAAWLAVARSQPEAALAIVDAGALPPASDGGLPGIAGLSFALQDLEIGGGRVAPVGLWIGNPSGPAALRVTVVGVIDRRASGAFRGLHVAPAALRALGAPARPPTVRYFVRLRPGVPVDAGRAALGAALFDRGVQTTSLAEQFQNQSGPLLLASAMLQMFVALGLLAGVAALGVISTRAALERRQEIGVLRALGYGRWTIGASLLLESGLTVLVGSALGVGLGLLVCRNVFAVQLFDRFRQGMEMVVPTGQIASTVALACLAALLASWLPARQAARVPPVAALRAE